MIKLHGAAPATKMALHIRRIGKAYVNEEPMTMKLSSS